MPNEKDYPAKILTLVVNEWQRKHVCLVFGVKMHGHDIPHQTKVWHARKTNNIYLLDFQRSRDKIPVISLWKPTQREVLSTVNTPLVQADYELTWCSIFRPITNVSAKTTCNMSTNYTCSFLPKTSKRFKFISPNVRTIAELQHHQSFFFFQQQYDDDDTFAVWKVIEWHLLLWRNMVWLHNWNTRRNRVKANCALHKKGK